ncbi:MAG TPA: ABC transporter ATP-binding protein, partial [Bacilli bacterium]
MRIENLSKVYKTRYEDVKALGNINLILPDKGLVFIVGVSGSGKTTLMNMLSRVDEPTNGDVYIGDKSLFTKTKEAKKQMYGYRNSYVGLIFQDYNLIEDLNVYDNIKLTLDLMGRNDYEVVDEVIKKIDIEDIKYSNVNEISSGQMQRVAIARALVKGSSMILADEPTGNLDTKNEKIIFDLLKEISRDRLVVVITHDGDAAIEYGDRIIEIEDGHVVNDSMPLSKIENEPTPTFIEPKLSLSQQLKFTFGFIRNNLSRSLSIFLVLLLIPVIGGILSGYVRYDVSVSYRDFQDKYGSDFIALSQPKGDYDLYYTPDQVVDIYNKYTGSNIIEYYDTYLDINPQKKVVDSFFKPVISNIIIYKSSAFPLDGRLPEKNTEILITDYVVEAIKFYQGKETVDK